MLLDNFHRIMPVTHLARPESKWDDDGLFHTYVRQITSKNFAHLAHDSGEI
jgi:hypothetical protein